MGRLIVLEGADGSGKATQTKLLCRRLAQEGFPNRSLSFPRYGQPSAAMIEEYLQGHLGSRPEDVSAYAASMFYAMDRYASYRQDWGAFYESGGLIVSDRYTTSNAVYQAAKLPPSERQAYLDWLFDLEYRLLELPKPDLVLYLDMPVEVSANLLRRRASTDGRTLDIHETDRAYLSRCRESALEIGKQQNWVVLSCAENGQPRPEAAIHEAVRTAVEPLLGKSAETV